jgi:hypothetical protein
LAHVTSRRETVSPLSVQTTAKAKIRIFIKFCYYRVLYSSPMPVYLPVPVTEYPQFTTFKVVAADGQILIDIDIFVNCNWVATQWQ